LRQTQQESTQVKELFTKAETKAAIAAPWLLIPQQPKGGEDACKPESKNTIKSIPLQHISHNHQ